jgi:endonuclease/exonuclease/phosphatase family metal-dependent hydrolase
VTVERKFRASKFLTAVLILIELVALLAASAAAIFFLQPYGQRGWTALALAASLAFVAIARSQARRRTSSQEPGAGQTHGRFLRLGANVLIVVLACWLGLLAWSSWSAGGALPPAKSDPRSIRFITWNILHGADDGAPWTRFGWPVRRTALESALNSTVPDILCVQEALDEQVSDLAQLLVGYGQVGVGRDDGRSGGEFCAVYFDRARFEELDGGTFWLEEPADLPPKDTRFGPKRICTWVRLRDRQNGRALRAYNIHLYLTESARLEAVRIILARMTQGDPTDAVLVAGDFNAPPKTPDRLLFASAGLMSSDGMTGDPPGAATYQFYGIRLRSLDDVLVNRKVQVKARRVLDLKPENTFPSDHFGVMTDLILNDR